MQWLTILGVAMVAGGLVALGYCIREAMAIRARKPEPEEARARLRRLVAINLAALGTAGLGLALVTVGVLL